MKRNEKKYKFNKIGKNVHNFPEITILFKKKKKREREKKRYQKRMGKKKKSRKEKKKGNKVP